MNKKGLIFIFVMTFVVALTFSACGHTHTYEDKVVPPTCTEGGYTEHVCSSCGESYRDNEVSVDENNHNYGEWQTVKEATCTEKGQEKRVCSYNSNHVETRDIDTVHKISLVAEKPATCTEDGRTAYYICSECNKWFSDKDGQNQITDNGNIVIAKKPHNYVDGICTVCERKQPTEGLKYFEHYDGKNCSVSGMGTATDTEIIIPEEYNGKPVTSIGHSAFKDCSITSIEIPDSVTSIVNKAFAGCSNLTSITIPNSIMSVYSFAFEGCNNLTYNEKDNLRYLGNGNNPYLCLIDTSSTDITSVKIDDNCRVIGGSAFNGCSSLVSVAMGSNVKSICEYAFAGCDSLTSIIIPDSLTSIGDFAFSGCSKLIDVTIPDGVTYIGSNAFSHCSSLTNITIPDGVTGNFSAFEYCDNLVDVTIGNGVTGIWNGAFRGCSSLRNVALGSSVTSIGAVAFEDCINLRSITIPDSIKSIGDGAFEDCTLTYNIKDNLKYLGNNDNLYLCLMGTTTTDITNATIDNGCKVIGYSAFSGCNKLTSVTVPSVISIGKSAINRERDIQTTPKITLKSLQMIV